LLPLRHIFEKNGIRFKNSIMENINIHFLMYIFCALTVFSRVYIFLYFTIWFLLVAKTNIIDRYIAKSKNSLLSISSSDSGKILPNFQPHKYIFVFYIHGFTLYMLFCNLVFSLNTVMEIFHDSTFRAAF